MCLVPILVADMSVGTIVQQLAACSWEWLLRIQRLSTHSAQWLQVFTSNIFVCIKMIKKLQLKL